VESSGQKLALALFRDFNEKKQMERELITKHAELRDAYVQLEKKNAELTTMQETLVQAGKMAALGELAAGIAHELNQPLQGIRGYAQELQELIPESQRSLDTANGLREIISSVDKMSSIISYLRTFTRKSLENYEFTDIHQSIEEAMKMLKLNGWKKR
jgi:two-component system C4-dicarboxylate transport sensor histidine kinase DctB